MRWKFIASLMGICLGLLGGRPGRAAVSLNAIRTGGYSSDGFQQSPDYTTGVPNAFGPEWRGFVVFDLTQVPSGCAIQGATLSLANPYSQNDVGPGDPLTLHVVAFSPIDPSNIGPAGVYSWVNQSNFNFLGGSTVISTRNLLPADSGQTLLFPLSSSAVADLQSNLGDDFYGFGMRIVKADAEEPKPLQFAFGGTAAGATVQLEIDCLTQPTATPTSTSPPLTFTPTLTPSETPTDTPTQVASPTSTQVPTDTPTSSATETPTPTLTSTATPTASATPTTTGCPSAPSGGCRAPDRSRIRIRSGGRPQDRSFSWTWRGAIPDVSVFGDPRVSTGHQLCLYNDNALALAISIPPAGDCNGSACWRITRTGNGFVFSDPDGTNTGIHRIRLQAGPVARVTVGGGGANLAVSLPSAGSLNVTVQLRSETGECWEAVFPAPPVVRTSAQFTDRLP